MNRRAFLARVAAIPLAAKAVIEAVPELESVLRSPYPSDEALAAISDDAIDAAAFCFEDVAKELKNAYPPGCFAEMLERDNPFLMHLKAAADDPDRTWPVFDPDEDLGGHS